MQNAKVDKLKEVKRSDMIPGDRGANGTDMIPHMTCILLLI